MIEEQYVSFETAKLAKEKGFNELLSTLYKDGIFKVHKAHNKYSTSNLLSNKGMSEKCYSAPTQSILARWLREKHGKNVYSIMSNKGKYIVWVQDIHSLFKVETTDLYDSYEKALEAGLQEALNLLSKI